MIVAIDGPAGSGKSTVAKEVAQMLGFHYLDTGAMYRSIAWLALNRNVALDDAEQLAKLAAEEPITFEHEPGNPIATGVKIAGVDVTAAIRTPEIDRSVSPVSAVPAVREAMVKQQRSIAASEDVVMEGRDIGTVVFPNAEVKVFLTADARERARRRALQNQERGFGEMDEEVIYQDILRRDEADSTRDVSPLRPAEDAYELNSTGLTIEEVCEKIASLVEERRA